MMGHSPLGASSAERWMNCPGSVALLRRLDLPQTDDPDYRREGTAAHEGNAKCLRGDLDAWEVMGDKFGDGVVCDEEMARAMQVYIDVCRPLLRIPHGVVYVERQLTARAHALMYGTVDFAVVADSLLNIVDYKHGIGVVVEAEDNPQLMYYAYLVLQDHPDVRRVVLRIVQPRGVHPDGPIRRWETTAEHICEWVEQELLPAMRGVAVAGDGAAPDAVSFPTGLPLDAGEWCRFCPAKLVCPLMTSLFGAACNANPQQVIALSDGELARSYKYAAAVRQYLKAMEEETFRRLNEREIDGVKLVKKKANRVWLGEAEAFFVQRYGERALTVPTLKSPAQMEDLDGEAPALVKTYAYTPDSGLTVALASDRRLGVQPQTAAQAFADRVQQEEVT